MRLSNTLISSFLLMAFILTSCQDLDVKVFTAFDVYCEMVANGAKPIALHYPMEPKEVDRLWERFQEIASKNGVQVFQEENWPSRIDDPLPPNEVCPKKKLHDTIKCLNRGLKSSPLRFRGDGTGQGVIWEFTE